MGDITPYNNIMSSRRLVVAVFIENMDAKAYKVTSIEYEGKESFNCLDEEELLDFLGRRGLQDGRDMDGCGIIEVHVDTLQDALDSKELKLEARVRDALKADIDWAKGKDEESVMYVCA